MVTVSIAIVGIPLSIATGVIGAPVLVLAVNVAIIAGAGSDRTR